MKSKSLLVTGICLATLALGAAPNASAKEKKTTSEATASASPTESASPAKRGLPYRGKIASVDSAAKTFTITTKKGESRVYKMTDATKIMKDGQPATMASIDAAAALAQAKLHPRTSKYRATDEYRHEMIAVLLRRTLPLAVERAQTGEAVPQGVGL